MRISWYIWLNFRTRWKHPRNHKRDHRQGSISHSASVCLQFQLELSGNEVTNNKFVKISWLLNLVLIVLYLLESIQWFAEWSLFPSHMQSNLLIPNRDLWAQLFMANLDNKMLFIWNIHLKYMWKRKDIWFKYFPSNSR